MLFRRIIICVVLVGLVLGPLESGHASRRRETNNPEFSSDGILFFIGGWATAGVFYLIYNKISGKQPKTAPRRGANNASLLISGDFGHRFFVAGEGADRFAPATPAGLLVRYQWRVNKLMGLSNVGLLVRTAEHDGRAGAEGTRFKITKYAITTGSYMRSPKATWEIDWGLGVVTSEWENQDGRDNGGSLLFNLGTSIGFRLGERFTLGPRVEFSNLLVADRQYTYIGYTYELKSLYATEILLQETISLF